ncbi:MAG: Rv2993c-like domain-containing protein, partial [Pseudomonadota bacterium]
MKLVTFTHGEQTRTGVMTGDRIADLNAADGSIPSEMVALLTGGDAMLAKAAAAAQTASTALPLSDVTLESPI